MFHPEPWAAAYINSLEKEGARFEDGIAILGILVSWVKSLPARNLGEVSGSAAAKRMETLIRKGIAEMNVSSAYDASLPALETAIRFLVLAVRKNAIRYIDQVINEIKKSLDKKNGVLTISAEYAITPDGDFESRIKEAIKKKTGANKVEYSGKLNKDLIGGYRLRIGDTVMDASIRSQLSKLEALLAVDGGH